MLTFWLLLRQTLTERQEKQKEDSTGLLDVHVEDQKKQGKLSVLILLSYSSIYVNSL